MKVFEYPFDSAYILKKQRSLKKELLSDKSSRIKKKIAVLTGSTADAVKDILELFLLNYGIEPQFYLSEYGQYYEDGLFPSEELAAFKPDIVYIHTTCRNITEFPGIGDSEQQVSDRLSAQFGHFREVWESLREKFGCTIIQNN
ncbi:MAG: HAD family hydrolase, partial [Ruminiclostridium sp.]